MYYTTRLYLGPVNSFGFHQTDSAARKYRLREEHGETRNTWFYSDGLNQNIIKNLRRTTVQNKDKLLIVIYSVFVWYFIKFIATAFHGHQSNGFMFNNLLLCKYFFLKPRSMQSYATLWNQKCQSFSIHYFHRFFFNSIMWCSAILLEEIPILNEIEHLVLTSVLVKFKKMTILTMWQQSKKEISHI